MSFIDQARAALDAATEARDAKAAELDAFADTLDTETRAATPDEDTLVTVALAELSARQADVDAADARVADLETVEASRAAARPAIRRVKQVSSDIDVRTAPTGEVRDAARKVIDEANHLIDPERQAGLDRLARRSTSNFDADKFARHLVASERDQYRSAFAKWVQGSQHLITDEERRAVDEVRAMSSTTTAGGFGVPVLIDPTILITDGQGLTGILDYCRIETITTDAWKGVSAGHTAWSFDAEGATVSDDASTFAQPVVTTQMARGYIPASIEISQDYPSFGAEIGRLLADGYQDLMAEMLMTGTGTNQPWGLFATTTTTVDVTTDNTFGAPDLDKVWAAVPEKFRARSTWVMNVDVENDVRAFDTSGGSRFTVNQTAEGISTLNGKAVVLSDHAPEWSGTDAAKILAVGDLSNFLVAQRVGMTIEEPFLVVDVTNNRPTGERGLFAHARWGSDLVVQNAVRVLKNITT